jgi:hypothetical protein
MPCKSLSLPIEETCKGRFELNGDIKEICKSCYADKGAYNWPNSVNLKAHNLAETRKHDFVPDMINKLYKMPHFRWFDSGDIENEIMLEKVYQVCLDTPNTDHWIPTKSRELFDQYLWEMLEALPNVKVRYSSPSKNGIYDNIHGSVAITDKKQLTKDMFLCKAKSIGFTKKGKPNPKKCHNCRACWYNTKVIAYDFH